MWATTSKFLQAIAATPDYVTAATFTNPGGTKTPVQIEAGSVSLDSSQNTRRQCSLNVVGDSDVYQQIMLPGTILHIDHGVNYGSVETVPVFHGEITAGSQDLGGATINLSGGDLAVRLARAVFFKPYTPVATTGRVQVIANVVTNAIPGTIVVNASSDTGLVGGGLVWTGGPLDVITDLTKDGGTEAFFLPDGSFMIRDRPVLDSPPAWTTKSVTSAARARPMDRLYNMVVVNPAATDGSQSWTQQIVELTDTTNPRHKSKIGQVPYILNSPTAATAAAAVYAGKKILDRVLGTTETLSLGSVTNPALEGSDVIGVIAPGIGQEQPQSFRHFIDSFTFDLRTAAMTLATRTTQVNDA